MARKRRLLAALALATLPAFAGAQPASVYERGVLEVRPDPGFGQGTDWAQLVENEFCTLAAAPDGSVFLVQNRAHTVHKLDRSGRLVTSFGRQGQGPGDFQFPQHLSILDGRHLVVSENAEGRRISLFDLNGRFVDLLKTGQGPSRVAALRDGVVAYVAKSYPRRGPLVLQESSVVLLNTATGRETTVCDHTLFTDEDQVFASPDGPFPKSRSGLGDMIIARVAGGDLAVGYTTSSKIAVFSPDGRSLREFSLDYPALKWTDALWRRYLEAQVELAIDRDPRTDPAKIRRRIESRPRITDSLPFFADMFADAEGRLVVVPRGDCFRRCDPVLRAYTPEGGLVGQTVLRGGDFEIEIDRLFRKLALAPDALYGILLVKGSPDDERRLVRVTY